jgi:hypothetical protein
MEINKLTLVGFQLNGALGSGKYDDVSIDQVKKELDGGDIWGLLERRLGQDADFSLLYNDDKAKLAREWESLANAVDESRKLYVERNGLCLLVAYLLEGIQRRDRERQERGGR